VAAMRVRSSTTGKKVAEAINSRAFSRLICLQAGHGCRREGMDGIRTQRGLSTAPRRQGVPLNAITTFLSERHRLKLRAEF